HTVHKPPGRPPRGSVWCTVFDAQRPGPFMHKFTTDALRVPPGGWIAVGDRSEGDDPSQREGAILTPERAEGCIGDARWALRFAGAEPELRHLPYRWLYRAPLPRTKLTSPMPAASFQGTLALAGRAPIELHDWRGMIGHNWGAEHAERWIWLHGVNFREAPEAWLDVGLGRVTVAGRMTPWIASGAFCMDGQRQRIGGLRARGARVAEGVAGGDLTLTGERGLVIDVHVEVPSQSAAGWRYADPDGGEHDVVNCSIAAMTLSVRVPGRAPRSLHSACGGAYELGMRERDHGVPIAPFGDG
ncbi:MAG: hypothetical protein M3Z95_08795, partial [Actinomycetota bacterium]|nr:hypothetical protein [Actinomycetota bacterium]